MLFKRKEKLNISMRACLIYSFIFMINSFKTWKQFVSLRINNFLFHFFLFFISFFILKVLDRLSWTLFKYNFTKNILHRGKLVDVTESTVGSKQDLI